MDPTNDIHFERNGLPLNGRELTLDYWTKNTKGMTSVSSDGIKTPVTLDSLSVYRGYSIDMEANQLSTPVTAIVNGKRRVLHHENDYHLYPLVGRDNVGLLSAFVAWKNAGTNLFEPDRRKSNDPDDFSTKKNQTFLYYGRLDAPDNFIKVVLQAEDSPTFKNFLCSIDDGDWQPIQNGGVIWSLHFGMNSCAARIETVYGWQGPISRAVVFFKPAVFKWWVPFSA
jgi:hypothetical protein